ncbi:hypothetical protein SAMN02745781_00031 [Vibrio gazogenes DSM 21264]|uniref:Uncharacterized protein n=1 Tax=Vibrio gazogenes DSM 21264 = NBRC 103151 TaxID=1123492 RepID=A0A1M4SCH5_VIBGA|nr:hypothetical protein SAMN02745781_00031 [Vibrio gazogenes DSM 21264] [Vibrio gazogenes DSM 21264 = NBRC 103151]SJN58237.1 hypothetical protein BQ6471_02932 [Vibrio gazogenes]
MCDNCHIDLSSSHEKSAPGGALFVQPMSMFNPSLKFKTSDNVDEVMVNIVDAFHA